MECGVAEDYIVKKFIPRIIKARDKEWEKRIDREKSRNYNNILSGDVKSKVLDNLLQGKV